MPQEVEIAVSNMWVRLIGESFIGVILLTVGIMLVSNSPETNLGLFVSILLIILGVVLIVDLFWAAATGKMRTPPTLGAGMAPAGSSEAERYERAQRELRDQSERRELEAEQDS